MKTPLPSGSEHSQLYEEVFVISQFWGGGFFHNMCEDLPRLAPYIEFLQRHSEIRVHVLSKAVHVAANVLRLLGIDPSRLVTGVCRAKVVYLPQSSPCGYPSIHTTQLLSHVYRKIIKERFPEAALQRNSIVVIRRSRGRKFKEAAEIEALVESIAQENGFRFELFPDFPLPSLEQSLQIFNRAVIVVAPHGAGLSNILFSEPGTVVIEGVCNSPHVNLCYQALAYKLGHKHYGLASREGCEAVVDIPPSAIGGVLKTYIQGLRQATSGNI